MKCNTGLKLVNQKIKSVLNILLPNVHCQKDSLIQQMSQMSPTVVCGSICLVYPQVCCGLV